MTTRSTHARRTLAPGLLVLALLVGAAACADGAAPTSAPATAPPASASPAPGTSGAPTPAGASARIVAADGLQVQVPAGWQATTLTEAARAQAVARETRPELATFLRERLTGLAARDATLYLYDLRALASGSAAFAEVYRYPPGRTPAQTVDEEVLPALQRGGLAPVRGQTVLPAGPALTVTTQGTYGGREQRSDIVVMELGPTTVSLAVSAFGPPRTDTAQLVQSLAVA
ncbi:MAG TPA: hypothetical protein VFR07_11970 [Mycobacteriales bacterium]|jgi:hypothetical protein|nr:hypothetical protein [Mycobacteriales bacterium]